MPEKRAERLPTIAPRNAHFKESVVGFVFEESPDTIVEGVIRLFPRVMLGIEAFAKLDLADEIINLPLIPILPALRPAAQFARALYSPIVVDNRLLPALHISDCIYKLRLFKSMV